MEDDKIIGLLINRRYKYIFFQCFHWFAVKKINQKIYNLDSKLEKP